MQKNFRIANNIRLALFPIAYAVFILSFVGLGVGD